MKVLLVGAGMMGTAVAKDLVETDYIAQVTVADFDADAAHTAKQKCGGFDTSIEAVQLDLADKRRSVQLMQKHDLVVGAYPERWAVRAREYALQAGVDLVDMTALHDLEKGIELDGRLQERGLTAIPGCGVAPGLSNILMGVGCERVDNPHTGIIMVGGLPQEPKPPLEYAVVFSFDTVIDEYTVPPRIIEEGEIRTKEPLSGLQEVHFDSPVKTAECFLTDGLTTLLYTMPKRGLQTVVEKTVRYPGHRDKLALLRDCGFFCDEPVEVAGTEISPREFTSALMTSLLYDEEARDVTCMRVIVRGDETVEFDLMDFYDEEEGVSSMARTTGYTCAAVARMLMEGHIAQKGFVPPEEAVGERNYQELKRRLRQRDIKVIESHPS